MSYKITSFNGVTLNGETKLSANQIKTSSGNAITFQDKVGTVALTSDIPDTSSFLTSHQSLDGCVKTSGDETITGTKTFTSAPVLSTNTITNSSGNTITLPSSTGTLALTSDIPEVSSQESINYGRAVRLDLSSYNETLAWSMCAGSNGVLLIGLNSHKVLFLPNDSNTLTECADVPSDVTIRTINNTGYNAVVDEYMIVTYEEADTVYVLNAAKTAWTSISLGTTYTKVRIARSNPTAQYWIVYPQSSKTTISFINGDHSCTSLTAPTGVGNTNVFVCGWYAFVNNGTKGRVGYNAANWKEWTIDKTGRSGSDMETLLPQSTTYGSCIYQDFCAYKTNNGYPYNHHWLAKIDGSGNVTYLWDGNQQRRTFLNYIYAMTDNQNYVIYGGNNNGYECDLASYSSLENIYRKSYGLPSEGDLKGDGNGVITTDNKRAVLSNGKNEVIVVTIQDGWERFDAYERAAALVATLYAQVNAS